MDIGKFGEDVDQIDFAVNSDIFEEVKEKVAEHGFSNNILNIGESRENIRNMLEYNFDSISNYSGLNTFFG